MITVYLFDHGWFWMIPLPDDVMSVGVVGTRAFFKAKGGNIDALFAEAVAATPSLAAHMAKAEPLGPLTACADYSYDSQSLRGREPYSGRRCGRFHRSAVFERGDDGHEQRSLRGDRGRWPARGQAAARAHRARL